MPLWAVGKALFLLDTSLPYAIFSSKSYAEFVMGAVVADISRNKDVASIYIVPAMRCSITSEKGDIDASKPNLDKLQLLKSRYPAVDLTVRLYGRTKDGGKYQTYGMRAYDYFNPLAQAVNSSMAYVVNVTKGASQARTDEESINYSFNQASKNGGMTAREIAEFFKAYVTIKLLVSVNIMHLKASYAPKILDKVKDVDPFHKELLRNFDGRFMQPESEWSANLKILNTYKDLVRNPSFHTTPEFQRLKTQFKGFGVELTLPVARAGGIPPIDV